MKTVRKFILKDVRCFDGRKEFNIRPLTFLIGENSTGKSTSLGCFQVLSDFMTSRNLRGVDFNNEPYRMGAFADIIRKSRSPLKIFELGFEFEAVKYNLTLMERKGGSEPIIKQMQINFLDGEIIIIKAIKSKNDKSLHQEDWPYNFHILDEENNRFLISIHEDNPHHFHILKDLEYIYSLLVQKKHEKTLIPGESLLCYLEKQMASNNLGKFWRSEPSQFDTYSFAPIRFKPERTYNPLKETASPEGSEIPMVLMNLRNLCKSPQIYYNGNPPTTTLQRSHRHESKQLQRHGISMQKETHPQREVSR